ISQIIPEVPRWLCDLIAKLHAKDPARRFQSAAEVATLLERHLAVLRRESLRAPPLGEGGPRQPKRRRVAILAAAAAAVVLGVLSTVLTYPLGRRPGPISIAHRPDGPGEGGGPAQAPAAAPTAYSAPAPMGTRVLQGRADVSDALIAFDEPGRSLRAAPPDNPVRRAHQRN